MHNRKESIVVILMILTLLLTACGNKKSAEASRPSDTQTGAPQAEVSTEQNTAVQGDPAQGEQLFKASCAACHGPEAAGIQGLGKSLHPSENEFISSHSDAQLVTFIKQGRQPGDPGNTTGVAMPPKGGNPALSDEDLQHIVAWMRTLE